MQKYSFQHTALKVTRWVGSPQSIVVHTVIFIGSFAVVWLGFFSFERMLLVLTTLVSLEAIYLAIFIQMTINAQQESLEEVERDIDEIQVDIDEIQEDVEDIQENEEEDEVRDIKEEKTLEEIRTGLQKLVQDVERLQQKS
ncbi:hypothetical protein KW798_00630 [Candidatus Parcubacteria bacterium]|nr:hypothetical protein [Candidatus Parcubacteria bacterium]